MSQPSFSLGTGGGDGWPSSQDDMYNLKQPPTRQNSFADGFATGAAAPPGLPSMPALNPTNSQGALFGSQAGGGMLFSFKEFDLNAPAKRNSSNGFNNFLSQTPDSGSNLSQTPVTTPGGAGQFTPSTTEAWTPQGQQQPQQQMLFSAPSTPSIITPEANLQAMELFKQVRERKIPMREAALAMATLCPEQMTIPLPPITQEEVQRRLACSDQLVNIERAMQTFGMSLEQIIREQMNAFAGAANQGSYRQLEEAQLQLFQQLELALVSLFEIIKTVVIDSVGLSKIRQIVLQIQLFQKKLELCRQELLQWASGVQPQPAFALWIQTQPLPHVVFKSKPVDEVYTVTIIHGTLSHLDDIGPLVAELCIEGNASEATKQLSNNSVAFNFTTRQATLNELVIEVSGRMSVMYLRFHTQITVGGVVYNIQSPLSFPFVVITNESQWADAAGKLLTLDAFMGQTNVPWPQFANTLHSHFLKATRQSDPDTLRPLYWYEFQNFQQKLGGDVVNQTKAFEFWRWFGQCVQCIRFKRHILSLWENGYIFPFMSKEDCNRALNLNGLATFLIRFSESNPGMFAIAFVCEDDERIMNCLVKNEDIGSNKSLPEFLREREQFQFVLRTMEFTKGELLREAKDVAFSAFYAKKKTQVTGSYVVL